MRCPRCSSKAQALASGRFRCPRCVAIFEYKDRGRTSGAMAIVVTFLLLVGFLSLYVQGAFDRLLYQVHLNWESCGDVYGEGAVLCGDDVAVAGGESGRVISGVKSRLN